MSQMTNLTWGVWHSQNKDKTIKIRMSKEREAAITTVVTELSMDDVFAMAADAKEKRESEKG